MTVFKRRFNYHRFMTSITLGMILSAATRGFAQSLSASIETLWTQLCGMDEQGGGSGSFRFRTA
jgi:hypothetical protein